MQINEETIIEIEKIFGFELYDWQKDYLLGKTNNMPMCRRSGRTFAYIVRFLLTNNTETIYGKVPPDEYHGGHYRRWFKAEARNINIILRHNGFETCILEC